MALREYILNHFWLKLFSLLAATLLWFWIQTGIQNDHKLGPNPFVNFTSRESVPVTVTVLTPPGDARVFKVDPEKVHVTITGEAAVLNELSKKELKAYADLTDLKNSEDDERLVHLHVPSGVTVIKVSPAVVKIQQVSP
ncbi:MAG: YbbR family protein [Verrucomicrobiales bacterium]|nr:YbbR family protein [Verrucomicrobiales bacterium]